MSWTNQSRTAVLGSDDAFRDTYCAAVTRQRLANVPPAGARRVIWRLTEILPLAAHATPRLWTPSNEPQPAVAIGRLTAAHSILNPRVALFAVGPHLHLAAERVDIEAYIQANGALDFAAYWVDYRSSSRGRLLLWPEPLDCQPHITLPPGHPLAPLNPLVPGHRLCTFLEWMAQRQAGQPWMVSPTAPGALQAQAQLGGIYPGLSEEVPPEPGDEEGAEDDVQQSGPNEECGIVEGQASGAASDNGCSIAAIIRDASAVLDAASNLPGRCGVALLNTEFRPQPHTSDGSDYHGPGIYALLFTPVGGEAERVVYIGSYRPAFRGNIVDVRWNKHLGTVTARGYRVSVRPSVQQQLAAVLPTPQHPLVALTENVCLEADAGCVASLNRLRFALENWSMFDPAHAPNLLAPFRWAYVRLRSKPPGLDLDSLPTCITDAEADLVDLLRPECNGAIPWGTARHDVTVDEFIREARQRLCSFWSVVGRTPPD